MADERAYRAAAEGAVHIELAGVGFLSVAGPDRLKFLNNLATNDVRALGPGRGGLAFVTSHQGRTLALATLLVRGEEVLLRVDEAAVAGLEAHFARYGLFDDVRWEVPAGDWGAWHVAGPGADAVREGLGLPDPGGDDLGFREAAIDGQAALIVRESLTGRPGWTLLATAAARAALANLMGAAMGDRTPPLADAATAEALRIEGGWPRFGVDFTTENLPQELGLDARAISFTKGCYLGQETVARIDALGHVNKLLKGLVLDGPAVPSAGAELRAEGRPAGVVTSAAYSPGWGTAVALGMVRARNGAVERRVGVDLGGREVPAEVHDLPMVPPG